MLKALHRCDHCGGEETAAEPVAPWEDPLDPGGDPVWLHERCARPWLDSLPPRPGEDRPP